MVYNLFNSPGKTEDPRAYSEFISSLEKDEIANVIIQWPELLVTPKTTAIQEKPKKTTPATNTFFSKESAKEKNEYIVVAPTDSRLIPKLLEKNVKVTVKPPEKPSWLMSILVSWFPMILLIAIWLFFMRQMQGGAGKAMSFGKSRAKLQSETDLKVTFADVAGVNEAKEELQEVVDFLKDPHKFTRLGGRIPKGILLTGSPGTGKTLLSRAVAGEAGVPFFSISGSDFVEMFVGVGASRVRDLFQQSKKNAPCIIFIDEIDAVGRHRGAGLGGGHDEREQTLNQLLVEMDGFESNEGVILIAATNRPDVLDPALLRPGRFDRQVEVSLPDVLGRKQILQVHMRKTPLADDVDVVALAKGTPGFSGADLENLINEAALIAARHNQDKLTMVDFEAAKDKVYMGLERKSKIVRDEDRRTTAYHEAGHALVARFLPYTDAVNKITIIPRGRAAGVTWFLPEEQDFRYKDQLESQLSIAYAGRVAEELVFGRISTGASNDIKGATQLLQQMVRSWGMSGKLGPISFAKDEEQIFLGREISHPRDYSDETARMIDEEISNMAKMAYERARKVLIENRDILDKLTEMLLEKETVLGQELDDLIYSMRPGIQLPSQRDKDESEVDIATSVLVKSDEEDLDMGVSPSAEAEEYGSCED